jgi:hypothetical protein
MLVLLDAGSCTMRLLSSGLGAEFRLRNRGAPVLSNGNDARQQGAPMKKSTPRSRDAGESNPSSPRGPKGAPLGTHSLTGGGANVGIPTPGEDKQRGEALDEPRPSGSPESRTPKR